MSKAGFKLFGAQHTPGARLERMFTALMPQRYDDVCIAFGHPILTSCTVAERAEKAYQLANATDSLYCAQLAIDFADSIVTSKPSFRQALFDRWSEAATRSWLPHANYRPVSAIEKIFKKGSPALPSSVRYIGLQLKRAASSPNVTTAPHRLLRDIIVAHGLKTFGDPRPIEYRSRKKLLQASALEMFEGFLEPRKAHELYDVLHSFTAGITAEDPAMAWALQRHSVGVTTALPIHSYKMCARRVVSPKVQTEVTSRGIPDTHMDPGAAKILREVTKGGTAKRLKLAINKLSKADVDIIRKYVTERAAPMPRPLHAQEVELQRKMTPVIVMWCRACSTWRINSTNKTPAVMIDLRHPGVGVCGSCEHRPLIPVALNGVAIGSLRLCSSCGKILRDTKSYRFRGVLTMCHECLVKQTTQQYACAKCGSLTNRHIVCHDRGELKALHLCTTHYPGPTAFDPMSSASDVLAEL